LRRATVPPTIRAVETVQVRPADASPVPARRALRWAARLAPWFIALILGAALLWIVPRASASRSASVRDASLSASVARERSDAASASAALASTQAQLTDARQHVAALKASARRRASEVSRMQAEAKKLRAEKARLSAPPATSTAPIVGKIGPPPPCHIVYYPDGSIGVKCG